MAKLSSEDFANTTIALKDFKRDLGRNLKEFEVAILVQDLKGDELYNFYEVNIVFQYNSNYDVIDIMWEPFLGNQYRDKGLYGRYSTTFNKMEYSYKELTIFSDDRVIILRG
jgi:hypothetical protein